MPFVYERTIRFPDTDAAGVVFFARYLAICHEAYEESLRAAGIELGSFLDPQGLILPIRRSTCDYLRPLAAGDRVRITVTPVALTADSFAVEYAWMKCGKVDKRAAVARTEHVCIRAATRDRAPLPPEFVAWIDSARFPA